MEGYDLLEKTKYGSEMGKIDDLSILAKIGFDKGNGNALIKLKELITKYPGNCLAHLQYSRVLVQPDNFDQNFEELNVEYEKASSEEIKVAYMVAVSMLLSSIKKYEEAFQFLKNGFSSIKEVKNLHEVYRELGSLFFKWEGESSENGTYFLEKAKKLNPKDEELIFDLAFKYNKKGNEVLALYHYDHLLAIKPKNRAGLNNKGIALDGLGFSMTKVECYLEAIQEGNTLASANLAYLLIDAGFYSQARNILETARNVPRYHKNVNYAFSKLEEEKAPPPSQRPQLYRASSTAPWPWAG